MRQHLIRHFTHQWVISQWVATWERQLRLWFGRVQKYEGVKLLQSPYEGKYIMLCNFEQLFLCTLFYKLWYYWWWVLVQALSIVWQCNQQTGNLWEPVLGQPLQWLWPHMTVTTQKHLTCWGGVTMQKTSPYDFYIKHTLPDVYQCCLTNPELICLRRSFWEPPEKH